MRIAADARRRALRRRVQSYGDVGRVQARAVGVQRIDSNRLNVRNFTHQCRNSFQREEQRFVYFGRDVPGQRALPEHTSLNQAARKKVVQRRQIHPAVRTEQAGHGTACAKADDRAETTIMHDAKRHRNPMHGVMPDRVIDHCKWHMKCTEQAQTF